MTVQSRSMRLIKMISGRSYLKFRRLSLIWFRRMDPLCFERLRNYPKLEGLKQSFEGYVMRWADLESLEIGQ